MDKVFQKARIMNAIPFFNLKKKNPSSLLETLPLYLNYIIFHPYSHNPFTYSN